MHSYPELYALAQQRYSCRSYAATPVPEDVLMAILDVTRLAPSACNRQPWLFIIADSDDEREAVARSYQRDWIKSAPVYIIACGLHDKAWHRPADGKDHTDVDVSIAVEHLCLAATSMHLATCWVCNFDQQIIREAFRLPDNMEPIAIIPLGYPAEGSQIPDKNRLHLADIVRRGKFSE
ncbi:MAG: nitroreductase family protein [Duncaniella sp.]|nr:nitroreductase family protein [Duncaniella sp.]MDE5694059.1 nitroreductase family protein [Duncaniella sp.]MDE6204947.1 nitroreductase family protein [Duncaniella sp.]